MSRNGAFEQKLVQRLLAQALAAEKSARLPVQGRCMEPLIRVGDWIEVRLDEPIRKGHVVLARDASGELVCHRVLARTEETLWLAGDRSLAVREHTLDSLLGVVHRVERDGTARRLGGWWTRGLNRRLADLHRLSLRLRGRIAGRVLERLRRMLLEVHDLAWRVMDVARPASTAGVSSLRGPASSR